MLIKLRTMMTKQQGFTLIELMVVIAVIGILSAIAIPKMTAATDAAKDAALKASFHTVDTAIAQYYATYGSYPTDGATLVTAKYITVWPKATDGTTNLTYARVVNNTAYNLTGTSTASASGGATTKYSPGSYNYVAW